MDQKGGDRRIVQMAVNRRFWLLSALRAHTKAPGTTDTL
jgi:hypothetical protein